MLQAHELHRHLAVGFRPADVYDQAGLPFSLNALAPIVPVWKTGLSSASDGGSLVETVREAFQQLRTHGVNALLKTWRKRASYRQDLRRHLVAAPHMIDDIGLTFEQAIAESSRPFWRR